jgi:hypothetical protein
MKRGTALIPLDTMDEVKSILEGILLSPTRSGAAGEVPTVPTGPCIEEGINELLSKRDLMKAITISKALVVLSLVLSVGVGPALPKQDTPQGAQQQSQQAAQTGAPKEAQTEVQKDAQKGEKPPLRPEELDQLLASIALYPDDLVAQVLSASTYPVEVVQAARFVKEKENAKLKGEKLMAAAKDKDWDPSVKAMLEFPDVLKMMDEKLDWTTKLGDAFLSQQREVMDSIQRLRRKANEAGNLKTTKEQKVVVEEQTQTIVIQPANPQVVYVPTYNPTVVYGTWPYPAYPPYPVYPPGYVATASFFSFAAGVAVGAAWGGWHSNWHGGDVDINVNRYNNFTRNNYTNANRYQVSQNRTSQAWQHNPEHRRGAQYTNQATAQRFGESRAGTRTAGSAARGYEGGARAAGAGAGTRDLSRAGGGAGARAATSSPRTSAFSGTSSGGSARAASVRGQASRSSPSFSGGRAGGGRVGGGARGGRS